MPIALMPAGIHNFAPVGDKKPPLPQRRHSMGQTSHKHLPFEDPVFFETLRSLVARPESPPLDRAAAAATQSLDTLASQTLGDLFGGDDNQLKRRALNSPPDVPKVARSVSHELFATHKLDLHDQLFRTTDQPAADTNKLAPLPASAGASAWLEILSKRKAAKRDADTTSTDSDSSSSSSPPRVPTVSRATSMIDKPPAGWTPTLSTVVAALRLRKLHERRTLAKVSSSPSAAEPSDAPSAAEIASAAVEDEAVVHVTSEDLNKLVHPEFNLQAFVEECWIAQASTDLGRKEAILLGAYDEPSAAMRTAAGSNEIPIGHAIGVAMPDDYGAIEYYHGGVAQPSRAYATMRPGAVPSTAYQPYMATYVADGGAYPAAAAFAPGYEAYAVQPPQAWTPTPLQQPVHPMMSAPVMSAQAMMWPQHPQSVWPSAAAMAMAQPAAVAPMAGPSQWPSLAAMAVEQEGSRLLQQQLYAMAPAELAAAVNELAPHMPDLATNQFGNYLISAMAGLPAAHAAIHAALSGHVTRLMQHPQGSRVTQAAFERLPAPLASSLVQELAGHVGEVACGTHGSWSVVAAYNHTHAPFIVREIAADIHRLARLQNGSRVVQRVLLEAASNGADIARAVDALLAHGPPTLAAMAEDKFGNYVVQICLRHATGAQQATLLGMLLPSFHALAVSKCGSNVAEVLVELSSDAQLEQVRTALGVQKAETLRSHAFGSYVMSALDGRRVA